MLELTKSKAYERRHCRNICIISGSEVRNRIFSGFPMHTAITMFLIFPPLRRFWETDLRTVRKTNRSTMRHPRSRSSMAGGPGGMGTVRGLDKFSGWVVNTCDGVYDGGGGVGLSRPSAPEPILIFPISFTIPFCWIIEPGLVCVAPKPMPIHNTILMLIPMNTSWGQVNLLPTFVWPNAREQSEKVNNEGIYVVRVRMYRLVHKYKYAAAHPVKYLSHNWNHCQVFMAVLGKSPSRKRNKWLSNMEKKYKNIVGTSSKNVYPGKNPL